MIAIPVAPIIHNAHPARMITTAKAHHNGPLIGSVRMNVFR